MEYIEREEIYRRWNAMPAPASTASLAAAIAQTPAADVAPVRHGRWVGRDIEHMWLRCSLCGREAHCATDYCPNCGARMDLEVNDG